MATVKVRLADNINRVIMLNPKATVGSTIGVDLKLPSGAVATVAQLQALLGVDTIITNTTGAQAHALLTGLTTGDDHPQYVRKDTLTANGDLYTRQAGVPARLAVGTAYQTLLSVGGLPAWGAMFVDRTPSVDVSVPAGGNIIADEFYSVPAGKALTLGANAELSIGLQPVIPTITTGVPSGAIDREPAADVVIPNNSGAIVDDYMRVAPGKSITLGNNALLTIGVQAAPGPVVVSSGGGGTTSPLTTKGDLWGYDTGNNRVPVGTDGFALLADSTQPLGVKWAAVGGTGTVTSVGVASTDLSVSGSPITGAGTITLNINSAAVTLAKIQNIAAASILGNNTGAPATAIELTATQVKTLLAITPSDVTGLTTIDRQPAIDTSIPANNNVVVDDYYQLGAGRTMSVAAGGTLSIGVQAAAQPGTTGSALSKTDDTNVTLQLGGAPASALLAAVSLTLGWTGTLAVTRGGSGAGTLTGYLVGNGTSPFTAVSTIPYTDITGTPSIPVGANPTASVGLTTVNGVAATFMRSDGAPAIDQSIVPTWTGRHTFSGAGAPSLRVSTSAGPLFASSAGTLLHIVAADGTATSFNIDSVGASPSGIKFRRIDGTSALPTGLVLNDVLGNISWLGYDGVSTFSTAAQIRARATETWSATVNGAQLNFIVTPNGTGTVVSATTIENDGGLFMNGATGSSKGLGTINAQGLYINGTQLTGANPTASLGLTAVNGTAVTYMRSDGAPALDQTIAPTWTGVHVWTSNSAASAARVSAAAPSFGLVSTGAVADGGKWRTISTALGTFAIQAVNDAVTLALNGIQIARNQVSFGISGITFGNVTDNPPFTFTGTGAVTTGGDIELGDVADTTVHRVSAGLLSVEGNILPHVAYSPTWTGNHTFTPASGVGITANATAGNIAIDAQNGIRSAATATDRQPVGDAVILANSSVIVDEYYRVASGKTLTIGAGGALSIGVQAVTQAASPVSASTSPLTTKGDLWGFDTANNRIPVGADTFVLTADSTQPLGVKWAAGGGGATGANPTASVGLIAVNGVATTYLRSDGAPALSQAITPTWTGVHIFSPASGPAIVANEAVEVRLLGNARVLAANATLNSNDSAVVDDYYTLGSSQVLTLPSGSGLTIGVQGSDKYVPISADGTVRLTPAADVGLRIIPGAATTHGLRIGDTPYTGTLEAIHLTNPSEINGDRIRQLWSCGTTNNMALFVTNAANSTAIITGGPTGAQATLRTLTSVPIVFGTLNTYRGQIAGAGNWSLAAPDSGATLALTGLANTMMFSLEYPTSVATGAYMRFFDTTNSLNRGYIGSGSTLFTGGAISDFGIASASGNLILSVDGGVSAAVSIATTRAVTIKAPTTGAALILPAGTTAISPLQLTSGTNLTTPTAGNYEYDGTLLYFTPGTARAVDLLEFYQCLSTTYTLTSQTAAQKLLNASANGAATLAVGVYEFECYFELSAMSASSGSFGFALGGAATFTQTWWAIANKAALATAAAPQMTYNTAANTTLATATTATVGYAKITGIIRVTVAGTVIPQVSLGVAAAAVVGTNSFCRFRPIGANASSVSVGTWS